MSDRFPLYRYRGTAVRAIDGDTLLVNLALGLRVTITVELRLARIDAPEVVGVNRAAGEVARDALWPIVQGKTLYIETFRDRRSFTRYIAEVWVESEGSVVCNVSAEMVARGQAVWSDGSGRTVGAA